METKHIEDTLAERGARYGDFTEHASIAQELQTAMRTRNGWQRLTPDKKQALTVIADKIARILSGDPEYRDNWHDIQGYAKLAEERCALTEEEEAAKRAEAVKANEREVMARKAGLVTKEGLLADLDAAVENAVDIANRAPQSKLRPDIRLALANIQDIINKARKD